MRSEISIYQFLDYRAFVRVLYQQERKANPAFSYAVLARRGEIASRAYIKLVIDGKRNLSHKSIPKFARALRLGRAEAKYFELLVQFSQEKDASQKVKFYRELTRFPGRRKVAPMAETQHQAYYASWYGPVIRELVLVSGFPAQAELREQAAWIVRALPAVSQAEAEQAISRLIAAGLLEHHAGQGLRQSTRFIESTDGIPDCALRDFHRQMICQALDRVDAPLDERNFSGVTLAVRSRDLPRAMESIRDFRVQFDREFSALAGADAVHELNIQFLRLSRPEAAAAKSPATEVPLSRQSLTPTQSFATQSFATQSFEGVADEVP